MLILKRPIVEKHSVDPRIIEELKDIPIQIHSILELIDALDMPEINMISYFFKRDETFFSKK